MGEVKKRRELMETARDLLLLTPASSEAEIHSLLDDGHYHLKELKGQSPCNETWIYSLEQRLRKAELLLEQKQAQVAR